MIPLVCIGERTRGTIPNAVAEIQPQIASILDVVPEGKEIVFAYEPVWAIGQPAPAEPEYVVAVVKGLRAICRGRGNEVRFLYGGSAGPGTFGGLKEGVDGLFLGRFAHDVERFFEVVGEVGRLP
jgi:triosephosphate isomerase (TIM)